MASDNLLMKIELHNEAALKRALAELDSLRAELAERTRERDEAEKREHANRVSCEQNFALLTDERAAHKLAHSQWCAERDVHAATKEKAAQVLERERVRFIDLQRALGYPTEPATPLVDAVAWNILCALHQNVPVADRPLSWSDMDEAQAKRVQAAARAALSTIEALEPLGFVMVYRDRADAAEAKLAALADAWLGVWCCDMQCIRSDAAETDGHWPDCSWHVRKRAIEGSGGSDAG